MAASVSKKLFCDGSEFYEKFFLLCSRSHNFDGFFHVVEGDLLISESSRQEGLFRSDVFFRDLVVGNFV